MIDFCDTLPEFGNRRFSASKAANCGRYCITHWNRRSLKWNMIRGGKQRKRSMNEWLVTSRATHSDTARRDAEPAPVPSPPLPCSYRAKSELVQCYCNVSHCLVIVPTLCLPLRNWNLKGCSVHLPPLLLFLILMSKMKWSFLTIPWLPMVA